MAEIDNFNSLLEQVNLICQKYDAIAETTGENFNIFKILNVEADEVRHSRILTTLLDPKGSHDCGDIFLKLFLGKCSLDAEINDCFVSREYSVDDGRIDIFVDCKNYCVVIENKIYGSDQEKQLEKYDESLRKKFDKRHIIYLTLYGDEASEQSRGSIKEYRCLSYKTEILEWLELCQKEVYNKPIIRETLEQYINLIKILTGQARSKKMEDEIFEKVAKDEHSIKIVFDIYESFQKFQAKLLQKYLRIHLESFLKDKGFKIYDDSWPLLCFGKAEWEEDNFCIRFDFQPRYNHYCIVNCIARRKLGNSKLDEKLKDSERYYKKHEWSKYAQDVWSIYVEEAKPCDWNKDDYAELCKPNNKIVGIFKDNIGELLKVIEKNI